MLLYICFYKICKLLSVITSLSPAFTEAPLSETQLSSSLEGLLTDSRNAVDDFGNGTCAITQASGDRWWAGKLAKRSVVSQVQVVTSLSYIGRMLWAVCMMSPRVVTPTVGAKSMHPHPPLPPTVFSEVLFHWNFVFMGFSIQFEKPLKEWMIREHACIKQPLPDDYPIK